MNKNQKGFSLIELLVVVIIIGIVAAIAIPNLIASRKAANQASAAANLRTLSSAQVTYSATNGTYGTLANLEAADLIDNSWTAATVTKNGFTFTMTMGANNAGFCATAVRTGDSSSAYSYAVSHKGSIYQLAGAAAPACDAATGDIATGTPVGSV